MDPETIRLVVTAISAVTAGLGGAFIAGTFNRRTAQHTLELTRQAETERWAKGVELEHIQWHRNQKQIAYEKFLMEAETLKSNFIDGSALAASTYTNIRRHRGHIKVLGSVPVRRAAGAVTSAGEVLRRQGLPGRDRNSPNGRNALMQFVDCIDRFVDEVRKDLQTSTPEDSALRQLNDERRQQRNEIIQDQLSLHQAGERKVPNLDRPSRSYGGGGGDDYEDEEE